MAEKCTHCEWKFKEGDMVIACPKCGALHHEKCWNTLIMNCSKCGAYTTLGLKYAKSIEEQHQQKTAGAQTPPQPNTTTSQINTEFQNFRNNVDNTFNNDETGMFSDIGERLKNWARTSFKFAIFLAIVTVIATLFIDAESIFIGIGAAIGLILSAWAFALLLYAFGELVSNSKESKKIQQEILNELKNKKE